MKRKRSLQTPLLLVAALCCQAQAITNASWIQCPDTPDLAAPVFRKTFVVEKKVTKAVCQASALGVYSLYLNGKRVGNDQLTPGWTDYRKEVMYQTYNLTPYLKPGENVLGAELTDGWYAGKIARGVYGQNPVKAFIASLVIHYKDGTTATYTTDQSWLCGPFGPLVRGDIYDGETYDARKGLAWCTFEGSTLAWQPVVTKTGASSVKLIPQQGPTVKIREALTRQPLSMTLYEGTTPTGTTYGTIQIRQSIKGKNRPVTVQKGQTLLVDFGQNLAGWVVFTVQGAEGTTVYVKPGEMLNVKGDKERLDNGPAGSIWRYNLRDAAATETYILAGKSTGETFQPSASFYGFRYAEITATETVTLSAIKAEVVGSELTEWGAFECSDKAVNQLYNNIWWGQRSNFLSVPTDCPQRDERLGWTGDTQIFARTALYNSDAADFYRKWMRDLRHSQREDGAYPDIAPFCNFWDYGKAAWADAGIIVPFQVYDMTGDKRILEENWSSMTHWMAFLAKQSDDQWQYNGAGIYTGDWLAYEPIDGRYVAVTYYAHVAKLMKTMASALGKPAEAAAYDTLYRAIRQEYQLRYLTPEGLLKPEVSTQTGYLLALRFDLLPETSIEANCAALRRKIQLNDMKLSTGFVGTGILSQTLSDYGMVDLAYDLLLQRENPSWLFSVDQGATTVWERWDSYTSAEGFNKHPWNMNSFNHYAYGAVAEWFYAYILGIQPAAPGFAKVRLCPHVDPSGRITYAKGKTRTPQGDIHAEWSLQKNGHYRYVFTLPKGLDYEVRLPNQHPQDKIIIR